MLDPIDGYLLSFYLRYVLPIIALYYWIVRDEMKGQHPIRRRIYFIIVPICMILAPITLAVSLIPMCFFIALGEAFDKPKPKPIIETKIDILEKHVPNRTLREVVRLIIAICLTLVAFHGFIF